LEMTITNSDDAIEALAEDKKPKAKRGRKAKEAIEPVVAATQEVRETEVVDPVAVVQDYSTHAEDAPSTDAPVETAAVDAAINLFVDCIPSVEYKSFWPIVNDITTRMAVRFGGSDWRTTDPNGPLGYGRSKGVLAASLREAKIEPGNYVLDGAMTETGAVVVEAMREVVAKSGGMMVRGIR